MQKTSGATDVTIAPATNTHLPIRIAGPARIVREAICVVYSLVANHFFQGRLVAPNLLVEFDHEEIVPQDLTSYCEVATRAGAYQVSSELTSVVTLGGNLPSILAAMSYMISF